MPTEPAVAEALRDCIAGLQPSWTLTGFPVLLFGTTDDADRVPSKILSCFKHEVVFEVRSHRHRRHPLLTASHRLQARRNDTIFWCLHWRIVHSLQTSPSRTLLCRQQH